MLELLKKHSLVGLTLAIAAGLLLYRAALELTEYLYDAFTHADSDVQILLTLLVAFCAGIFFLVRWLHRSGKMPTWATIGKVVLRGVVGMGVVVCISIPLYAYQPRAGIAFLGLICFVVMGTFVLSFLKWTSALK